MNNQKYITVLISKNNKIFLPHNSKDKSSFFTKDKPIRLNNSLSKIIRFGILDYDDFINPFDFSYIIGYVTYDDTKQNTLLDDSNMTITKVVTSWADGDALKGRTLHKKIGDIDYNSICREIEIDNILT